ncbi:MAG TPA: hypothetical protein V6C57_15960 [Coleofasciculaceae cyanobacterium]
MPLPENIRAVNRQSLQTLVRSVTLNPGEFSLIVVRCNYGRLQRMLLDAVQETTALTVGEVKLTPQTPTLYKAVQAAVRHQSPQVLMITGLESVPHAEALLAGANLVRDEFRKNFRFPLVLWTTDQMYQMLTQVAQDLRNFAAGSIAFKFPIDELITSLRQHADRLFETLLYAAGDRFLPNSALNLDTGSRLRTELDYAVQDIRNSGQTLDPELQAGIDFLRGRDAQARLEMEQAKTFYEQSLAFWAGEAEQDHGQGLPAVPAPKSEMPSEMPLPEMSLPKVPRLAQIHYRERQACLLFHLGSWWRRYARMRRADYRMALRAAQHNFQACLDIFRADGRLDLVAQFITALGETLQKLGEWPELEALAHDGLVLHQRYADPLRLARDYGFLAEVALARSPQSSADWLEAKTYAEQALDILDRVEQAAGRILTQPPMARAGQDSQEGSYKTLSKPANQAVFHATAANWEEDALALAEQVHRGWYLLLLARSLAHLGDRQAAIQHLETAHQDGNPQADPTLYIQILQALQSLYFTEERYLDAFQVKQQRRIIQQQYGFTAFVGASRLEPRQIASQGELVPSAVAAVVMQEIAASGRQQDVNRLVSRISLPRDRLTVIHGASGVGKSSIITVGLIPALRQKRTIEARQILPILVSVYNGWVGSLDRGIAQELESLGEATLVEPAATPEATPANPLPALLQGTSELLTPSPRSLITQIRQNSARNLYTVLIFDQFEEFFFAYPELQQRRSFYLFLKECLNIPYVKVVLSLREDYLHYLLEIDRIANLEVINHDILSKQIRYPLGDFSLADARTVIHSLTERSQFSLEAALVDRLVDDLAGELGGVRPIELQIVGAQLQDDGITTLSQYEQLGADPKETLVQRSLEDVIDDCGEPNEAIAQAILFLLTQENETRPLKPQAELAEELMLAEIPYTTPQLELVLEILVGSGLVLKIPEEPVPLYQLVHDYLVPFIREQRDIDLLERLADVEAEMASVQAQRDQLAVANRELDEANRQLDRTNQELGKANQGLAAARRQERQVRSRTMMASAAVLLVTTGLSIFLARDAWLANRQARVADQQREVALQATEVADQRRQDADIRAKAAVDRLAAATRQRQAAQVEVERANQELAAAQANLQNIQQGATQANAARLQAEARVKAAEAQLSQANANLSQANAALVIAQAEQQKARIAQQEARAGTRLERAGTAALQQFQFSQIEALVTAVKAGKELQTLVQDGRPLDQYPAATPLLALQAIADNIRERVQVGDGAGRIQAVQFSPQGDRFVTAGTDGTFRLWDLQGALIQKIVAAAGGIRDVQFSPNGQTIATRSSEGDVRLWSAQGTLLRALPNAAASLQFNAIGQLLTIDTDHLRIWDPQGNPIASLPQPAGIVSAQLSPNGQQLAILDDTGKFSLLALPAPGANAAPNAVTDAVTALEQTEMNQNDPAGGLSSTVSGSVQFSPNGQYLALSNGQTVRLWNLKSRQFASITGQAGNLSSLQFSPDSQFLATAGEEGVLRLWQVGDRFWQAADSARTLGRGNEFAVCQGHRAAIRGIQFSRKGQIATRSDDNTIRLWDIRGNALAVLRGHRGRIESMQFSPDGQRLLTGGADGTARLWNLQSNASAELPDQQGDSRDRLALRFSPTGQQFVTGSKDGVIRLWDLQGHLLQEFRERLKDIQDIQLSTDGQKLAVLAYSASGTTLRLWDIQGNVLAKYPEPPGNLFNQANLHDLRLSPNGQFLAALGDDGAVKDGVRLWNTQTNQVKTLTPGGTLSLQWSPDGQRLATGGTDGIVRLWDLQGNLIRSFQAHTAGIQDIQFSPNGQRLATGSADGTAKLWDLQGNRLNTLTGHRGNVLVVQFSPDGQRLATGGADGTARLWTRQGVQLAEFRGHQGSVLSLQFRSDGQRLATRSEDGTTRLWGLQGQQIAQYDGYQSALSPNWQYIATATKAPSLVNNDRLSRIRLWQIDDLAGLLSRSCTWLQPYLAHAPDLDAGDRRLCDGITSQR